MSARAKSGRYSVRAVVVPEPGGPEVLQVREVADPEPGPGEVVLDVAATAVNRADLLQRQGNYPPPPGASGYLGLECSGTVAAVGSAVAGWHVGDQACALLSGGGYAERVAVPVGQLLPVPAGVSLVDAAALPETTCTVWSMVFGAHAGRLQPGERLLVHGGTSGIGTMAIQIAHARGATVFATAGTPRKLAFCRELGAAVAINYRDEVFDVRVAQETDGAGVDVVLDNMGAAYLPRNLAALAVGGRLIVLGLQGGVRGELNLGMLLAKRATVHAAGLRARPPAQKADVVTETHANVWPMIESGAVRPIIDRVLTLDDAAEAHRLVESSEHIGKVLLRVR
jgi:putative PIG3 family NAD(P)H quinone oxidoreductase